MSQDSPQVFNGRYAILRHVARGGMAEVYLAHDQMLDRRVALKVLFPELSTDPSFVERFRREAQAAANLAHPNIVSIYDWGEENGTYFIVMEYVEGRTLGQVIRSEGPLLPDRAADIAADVASGLAFAHRNGVIHRDVKPGNVLLDAYGQVKVTDFGIARAADADHELTQTGAVMGTATYFSPEQAQGLRIDQRSDVYALGIVLYEMVVGRPPFQGDNPTAIAIKHVREQPVPPRQINRDIPAQFEAIVRQAIAKNPADRYASADEFRADLIRYRQGRPVIATPTLVAAPGYDPGVTTAAPVYEDATQVATAQPPLPPAGAPDKGRTWAFAVLLIVMLLVLGGLLWLVAKQAGLIGESAPQRITVPMLIGMSADDAEDKLTEVGLKVSREEEENDTQEPGHVFDQNPKGDSRVDRGSEVVLRISLGVEQERLPNVVGKSEDNATKQLEDLDFLVTVKEKTDTKIPEGTVLEQAPGAGESAPKGSTVEITVSTGKPQVEVPDVVGKSADEAANILGRAGFTGKRAEESSTTVDAGKVIRTDPPAKERAPQGSTVTYVVSSGAAKATVPNVLGMTRGEAKKAIEDAGLVFKESSTVAVNPEQDGRVQSQNPSGGSKVEPGSTVAVTVGKGPSPTTTSTTAAP
ncbi:MAG: Stk1 family PASTA domain-containing Ser/Thr kinase [Acidimicrobiales bacterium]